MGFGAARDRIVLENILIELQPDVLQGVGRAVDVGDRFAARNAPSLLVERNLDAIVGALLPILRTRGAGRGARRAG